MYVFSGMYLYIPYIYIMCEYNVCVCKLKASVNVYMRCQLGTRKPSTSTPWYGHAWSPPWYETNAV